MQRILRMPLTSDDTSKIALIKQYDEFVSLIQPHVSARSLTLLAKPKKMDEQQIGWFTNVAGQPILLNQVNSTVDKAEVEKRLNERLQDISTAVSQLKTSPTVTESQQTLLNDWLARINNPANQIYAINNDPVMVWDFGEPPPLKPVINPAYAVASTVTRRGFFRWWHFLLLALLLLGLLALLWYLFCPYGKSKQPIDNVIEPTPIITSAEPEPEPVVEPEPIPEPEVAPEPEVIPEPVVEPEPEIVEPKEPVNTVKNPPNCVTQTEIKQNKNPSKMVMIFDNSGSMLLTLDETPAEIDRYYASDFSRLTQQQIDQYNARMTREPSRLTTSKQVALSTIDKIQPNVDIGLMVINSCPSADNYGVYNFKQRSNLKNKISQLEPLQYKSATPLYSSLEMAAKTLDGVNRDDYILIISDGEDNCSDLNICTLSYMISKQKPRLKINIIDIAGMHKIDCVADLTGGNVFIAQDHDAMITQTNKALGQMTISKPVCK